jgi:hypothetical protein
MLTTPWQPNLPLSDVRSPSLYKEPYSLIAIPDRNGFFGLRQLQKFTETIIEPYALNDTVNLFVLDFSLVKVWDISAVLWLIVGLHHYRQQGFRFLLRLPEGKPSMPPSERDDFDQSGDFLRRWRFDKGILNLHPNPDALLISEQRGYFSNGPKRFYLERRVNIKGVLEALISQRLVEIKNLSDIHTLGPKSISDRIIAECIASFQAARIGDILSAQCEIEKRKADLFADHLLSESLMNVKEHPEATIGMMAISVMGAGNELILAVVDNGCPISETIYSTYAGFDIEYPGNSLELEERAKITDFATQKGISRKPSKGDEEVGMGLFYIKNDTLDTFGGNFRILTNSLRLKYEGASNNEPKKESWPFSWRGNLLRIAIPIT